MDPQHVALGSQERPPSEPATTPWAWVPDPTAWFETLVEPLLSWTPALTLDSTRVKFALADAIDQRRTWLRHPCLSPLTMPYAANALGRDFQFVVWLAAHSDHELGPIQIPQPLMLWSPGGAVSIAAGEYALRQLGTIVQTNATPVPLALDVWCHTLGYPLEGSWAAEPTETVVAEEQRLTAEIVDYCRTIALTARLMPPLLQWLLAATQVVIPTRGGTGGFRSGSQANLPGLVYSDLHGGRMQILETLVHETAHNHLYVAEATGPLIDPEHTQRYYSPLRPEPRPLRGILLACHALAYICAAIRDARQSGFIDHERSAATLLDLQTRMDVAEATLLEQGRHMTAWGRRFFDQTREVCAYGRAAA